MRICPAWLGLSILLPLSALARPLAPEDWYAFQEVSDLAIAPDGATLAYVVTRYERARDEARGTLWRTEWSGGTPVALTQLDVSAPRFSPDGRCISFLAAPPHAEREQLWLIDRHGGAPRQVSHVTGVITDYAWSPDNRHVALVMHARAAPHRPQVIDGVLFKLERRGYLDAAALQHLFLLDTGSGNAVPLVSEPRSEQLHPAFAPDGARIAYVQRAVDEGALLARDEVYLVEARAGAVPRHVAGVGTPNHQRLQFTPDGSALVLLLGDEPRYNDYINDQPGLLELASGALKPLAGTLDRQVHSPVLTPAGLALTVEDDGYEYPARLHLPDGQLERLGGPMVVHELVSAAGHTAVVRSEDRSPAEVYALEDGKLRPLSAHNAPLLRDLDLVTLEDVRFASRDGTEVHGQLLKPPGYRPGERYPAIIWIHGGPEGQDDHSLDLSGYGPPLERQFFASHGYVVLAVNYRGSTGRGRAWARAIAGDWGHLEVEDLLGGAAMLVERGLADPERLGIGGWSYGGLLTDYTIASDTRFRAAISGAGSGNQTAMFGADEYVVAYQAEVGAPWVERDRWLQLSYPFFHADRIRTPTLFMGGDADFDVPIAGGEQMYQALRLLKVPTELVVYPDERHVFTRPSYLVDRWGRFLAWMDRYLKGSPGS
ncbi:MAG: S9 family peptidase [Gammaproteobacteria bacterium]|nr:S9 family peptidase [Gammaproteobacteria bacterium]MBV9698479.1 S9 family peptidase [Gammaproteobacteria bacterium]